MDETDSDGIYSAETIDYSPKRKASTSSDEIPVTPSPITNVTDNQFEKKTSSDEISVSSFSLKGNEFQKEKKRKRTLFSFPITKGTDNKFEKKTSSNEIPVSSFPFKGNKFEEEKKCKRTLFSSTITNGTDNQFEKNTSSDEIPVSSFPLKGNKFEMKKKRKRTLFTPSDSPYGQKLIQCHKKSTDFNQLPSTYKSCIKNDIREIVKTNGEVNLRKNLSKSVLLADGPFGPNILNVLKSNMYTKLKAKYELTRMKCEPLVMEKRVISRQLNKSSKVTHTNLTSGKLQYELPILSVRCKEIPKPKGMYYYLQKKYKKYHPASVSSVISDDCSSSVQTHLSYELMNKPLSPTINKKESNGSSATWLTVSDVQVSSSSQLAMPSKVSNTTQLTVSDVQVSSINQLAIPAKVSNATPLTVSDVQVSSIHQLEMSAKVSNATPLTVSDVQVSSSNQLAMPSKVSNATPLTVSDVQGSSLNQLEMSAKVSNATRLTVSDVQVSSIYQLAMPSKIFNETQLTVSDVQGSSLNQLEMSAKVSNATQLTVSDLQVSSINQLAIPAKVSNATQLTVSDVQVSSIHQLAMPSKVSNATRLTVSDVQGSSLNQLEMSAKVVLVDCRNHPLLRKPNFFPSSLELSTKRKLINEPLSPTIINKKECIGSSATQLTVSNDVQTSFINQLEMSAKVVLVDCRNHPLLRKPNFFSSSLELSTASTRYENVSNRRNDDTLKTRRPKVFNEQSKDFVLTNSINKRSRLFSNTEIADDTPKKYKPMKTLCKRYKLFSNMDSPTHKIKNCRTLNEPTKINMNRAAAKSTCPDNPGATSSSSSSDNRSSSNNKSHYYATRLQLYYKCELSKELEYQKRRRSKTITISLESD